MSVMYSWRKDSITKFNRDLTQLAFCSEVTFILHGVDAFSALAYSKILRDKYPTVTFRLIFCEHDQNISKFLEAPISFWCRSDTDRKVSLAQVDLDRFVDRFYRNDDYDKNHLQSLLNMALLKRELQSHAGLIWTQGRNKVTPLKDTPVMDTPVTDTSLTETPVLDSPVIDTPVMDTPLPDTTPYSAAQSSPFAFPASS